MTNLITSTLDRIRDDFPILSQSVHGDWPLVYLDNAATTQRPKPVIDRLVEVYERHYANVHRGIHWLSEQSTDMYEEARESVRELIHASNRNEIVFTTGTTAAINLVAHSWGDANIRNGDEILVTEMEHHSNIVPWFQLAQRTGCKVRFLPITDDGLLDMDALPQFLTEKTKLFAFAAVSNVLGTINPVKQLVESAHSVGALTLVDAAQAIPHQPVDVQDWNSDFATFSGHKMMGPSGVGVMYGRLTILTEMPPFLGGGSMIERVTVDGFDSAAPPARFEAGTPPIVPALGLHAAIDYLQTIGFEAIENHERQLVELTHGMLEEIGGIQFLGPSPEHKSGIVSFVIDGIHAHDVAQILDRRGIAIRAGHHCAMPLHKRLNVMASNRASFYLYNTAEEVEKMALAIGEVKRVFRR